LRPRFSFKKVIKSKDGPVFFDINPVDAPNVHGSYHKYCTNAIVNDIKESALYVSEEPLDLSNNAQP
jgi:hypothetical protein